ncbi:MAG: response regulator transcription factor [Usitatibacteraceae bacterium]
MLIAILEDDTDVGAATKQWLEAAGYHVMLFASSTKLLSYTNLREFDLFILDWVLPDVSGLEVLKLLKAQPQIVAPVIFATIRDAEIDVVRALDAGADDFLIKPIRRHELLARIKAVTRRLNRAPIGVDEEIFGSYRFVPSGRQVYAGQQSVDLTAKEFELAMFLFKNAGKLLSRDLLSNTVWGRPVSELSRTIDTHISRIRKKLDLSPENGFRLQPIYNTGYRLERVAADS